MTIEASDELDQSAQPPLAQPAQSAQSDRPPSGGIFARRWYRWLLVAISFVFLAIFGGFGFYSLSTFSNYLVGHNGISLTSASTGSTVYLLSSGFAGLGIARVLRRWDVRVVLCIGVAFCVVSLPLIGYARNPAELWVFYLLYGVGAAATGMLPATTLIIRWFGDSPDRAIALATTGMSVGGAVVAPFVASWIAAAGLKTVGLGLAIITAGVIVPLSLALVRSPVTPVRPSPIAQELEDVGDRSQVVEVIEHPHIVSESARRRTFLVLCIAFGLLMASQVGAVTHMLTLGSERHIGNSAAALSALAATSVCGRLLGIPLLPRIGLHRFCYINGAIQGVAMLLLAFASSWDGLILSAMVLGATVGNTVVLLPLSVLDAYGLDAYPRQYARLNLLTSFGVGGAPLLVGVAHDAFGSYRMPMVLLGIGSFVASLLLTLPRTRFARTVAVGNEASAASTAG